MAMCSPLRSSPGPWEYRESGLPPGMMWIMYAAPEEQHAIHIVNRDGNTCSPSTNRVGNSSTLRESPPGQRHSRPQGATSGLRARDVRKPLTISVQFIGNGDCEWLVMARGKRYKFAGCQNVHECLAMLSRAARGF